LQVAGNPGSGKTILAAAAIDELKIVTLPPALVCYFFFQAESSLTDTITAAYRSILAQILQHYRNDEDVLDKFSFALNESSTGQLISTKEELVELLEVCGSSRDITIVLDGIDECLHYEELIRDLGKMFKTSTTKLLLFSRPHVSCISQLTHEQRRLAVGAHNSADISLFIDRRLSDMIALRQLPPASDRDKLQTHLELGAGGMFLWARLMFDYLGIRSVSRQQRYQTILDIRHPEGLDRMYDRIVEMIRQYPEPDRILAERVIGLIAFSKAQMTCAEVKVVVEEFQCRHNPEDYSAYDEAPEEFRDIVLDICASVIECVTSPGSQPRFQFIHLSAIEHFRGLRHKFTRSESLLERQTNIITTPKASFLCELAEVFLQHLIYRVCSRSSYGGVEIETFHKGLMTNSPLCKYAVQHWPGHLFDVINSYAISVEPSRPSTERLQKLLTDFLSKPQTLFIWIERSYALHNDVDYSILGACLNELNSRQSLLNGELVEEMAELHKGLVSLKQHWHATLCSSPREIWNDEVTAFIHCRLFPRHPHVDVTSLAGEVNTPGLATTPLCKVSETSSDGMRLGLLTVWPSQ
jgi:hypothetical protein